MIDAPRPPGVRRQGGGATRFVVQAACAPQPSEARRVPGRRGMELTARPLRMHLMAKRPTPDIMALTVSERRQRHRGLSRADGLGRGGRCRLTCEAGRHDPSSQRFRLVISYQQADPAPPAPSGVARYRMGPRSVSAIFSSLSTLAFSISSSARVLFAWSRWVASSGRLRRWSRQAAWPRWCGRVGSPSQSRRKACRAR